LDFVNPQKKNFAEAPKMHVTIFSLDLTSYACAQLRLLRPLSYLSPELNYTWSVQSDGQNYAISYDGIDRADIFVLQRYFPLKETWPCIEKIIKTNKPIVYEIDDLLWEVPPNHPLAFNLAKTKPYLLELLPQVNAVTVTTPELAQKIKSYNPNVFIFPNFLDPRLWEKTVLKPKNKNKIKIGFIGSSTHGEDLLLIEKALLKIIRQRPNQVEVICFGCITPKLQQYPQVRYVPFVDGYVAFCKKIFTLDLDIGLAPLIDNDFNRCKSNVKWLEYSACAIAGVYANLPPYATWIHSGQDGLLAGHTWQEWFEAIEFLIDNPQKRLQMAYLAQKRVLTEFNLQNKAILLKKIYRQLLSM